MDVNTLKKLLAFKNYLRLRAIGNRPKSYFKYMSARVAKIVLVNQSLRWSSPLLFNDPFDVERDFGFGFDIEELKEPLREEIVNLLSRGKIPDLSCDPRFEWFIRYLRRDDRAKERDVIMRELPELLAEGIRQAKNEYNMLRTQWREFLPEFRILCLSAIHDNMLMWSHYSDSHKGVVLEFRCTDNSSVWWMAQPVRYQDAPPTLATKEQWVKSITRQAPLDTYDWQLYEPLTLTKTKAWEHEREWRIVNFMREGESGLYADYHFNARELSSVYLGCEIMNEDATDVLSLLKYDLAHVTVWRGRKSERERRVCFDRVHA